MWLGNARGNLYSRGHTHLKTTDSAYWAFSFDEMGKYDIPAAMDYMFYNVTSTSQQVITNRYKLTQP